MFLFAAAALGALVALMTFQIMCYGESGGSTTCPNGDPSATMLVQLSVAGVGLVAAAIMLYSAFQGRKRAALRWMLLGFVIFAIWAILNDAAVHGWGHEMRFY